MNWVLQIFQNAVSKSPSPEEVKLFLDLKAIPAPIAGLPGLKRVDLTHNKLAGELCEGPWLDSLEELCLSWNDFAQLPSALLQCKGRLRKLKMLGNSMGEGEKLSDQTKDLYQELVAAGTKILLDERAHSVLEASL